MCVHFQSRASSRVLQHRGGRRVFVEAAALLQVTVYWLQENLVDYWPCDVQFCSFGLVVVYVVRLWDGLLLQQAQLLQPVRWSVERDYMKGLDVSSYPILVSLLREVDDD